MWGVKNLALLAGLLPVMLLVLFSLDFETGGSVYDAVVDVGVNAVLFAPLFYLLLFPGALLYLWIVSRFPPEWSRRKRRAVAVAASPIAGVFLYLAVELATFPFLTLGLTLPFGALVRLPAPSRSTAAGGSDLESAEPLDQ